MAEDWKAVAAEVEAALASIGYVTEPNGHPAVIRKAGAGEPANPWDSPGGEPTLHQVVLLISDDELRDMNGTLIGQVKRTVTISGAAGVVPHDDDEIALGVTVNQVDGETAFHGIEAVKPLAPAGVPVLYDIVLAG